MTEPKQNQGLLNGLDKIPSEQRRSQVSRLVITEEIALERAREAGDLHELSRLYHRAREIETQAPRNYLDPRTINQTKRHARVVEYYFGTELRKAQQDGRIVSFDAIRTYANAVRASRAFNTGPVEKPGLFVTDFAERNFLNTSAEFLDGVDEDMFKRIMEKAVLANALSRAAVCRVASEIKSPKPGPKFRIVGKSTTTRQIQILDNVHSSLTAGISVLDSAFKTNEIEKTLTPELALRYARQYRKAWAGISQTVKKLEEYGGTDGNLG